MELERKIIGAEKIPKKELVHNDIKFKIFREESHNSLEASLTDDNKLYGIANVSRLIESGKTEPRHKNVSIVQIIPNSKNNEFELYIGTDNSCCHGALFRYGLSPDLLSLNLKGYVDLPFNVRAVLSNKNGQSIVYGAGCDGSGIRFVDFNKGFSKEIVPTGYKKNTGLSYPNYCLFFNPPQIENNKLYVSYFDKNKRFFCDERAPRTSIEEKIIFDLIKRLNNQLFNEAFEICIDEKMKDFSEELTSIKNTINDSYFLYSRTGHNWQTLAVVAEEAANYLKAHPRYLTLPGLGS